VHYYYKFTGKERDAESGLDYFGARYYASNMGRWMSPDWADKPEAVPYSDLENPQSLNLYGYVKNNPLSQADPDGHCCWDTVKQLASDHPRTMQAAKGTLKVVGAVATVGVAAASEVPTGGLATAGVIFAVQGAVAMGVSGVTDIAGAATKTDVSDANNALDAVSNPAGQIVTAATGSLEKGGIAATAGDVLVGAGNLKSDVKEIKGLIGEGQNFKAGVKAAGIGQTAVNGAQEASKQIQQAKQPKKDDQK
jgi:RHS repeat-associated protein